MPDIKEIKETIASRTLEFVDSEGGKEPVVLRAGVANAWKEKSQTALRSGTASKWISWAHSFSQSGLLPVGPGIGASGMYTPIVSMFL